MRQIKTKLTNRELFCGAGDHFGGCWFEFCCTIGTILKTISMVHNSCFSKKVFSFLFFCSAKEKLFFSWEKYFS
jgi:hypothetical protein